MIVYQAGGITGNLNPFWSAYMDLYLAGTYSRSYVVTELVDEAMKVYQAGIQSSAKGFVFDGKFDFNILESFYYINDWILPLIPQLNGFMLDSGAFTFMQGADKVDWIEYTDRYAEFINQNDIELFFELDIDSIVGYDEVKNLRKLLEQKTGKQPIPVFHKSRGRDEFIAMAKDYPYIAIGGIVSKEITKESFKHFPWFINTAHEHGAKIHGLGFTSSTGMKNYRFDSVDSTAWLYGNRGGFLYKFRGGEMTKINVPEGKKLKSRPAAIHNFREWVKLGKYAQENW